MAGGTKIPDARKPSAANVAGSHGPGLRQTRAERLAEELRGNLRKRKAAARSRQGGSNAPAAPPDGDGGAA